LSKEILFGSLKSGGTITIDLKDGDLVLDSYHESITETV